MERLRGGSWLTVDWEILDAFHSRFVYDAFWYWSILGDVNCYNVNPASRGLDREDAPF